jgi:WD40 repeat protein
MAMTSHAAGPGSPQILADGDLVDHFRVRRLLGRGGAGEVYLARDTRLGRRVALKLVRPEAVGDGDALARFLFEARVTAQFSHPHIVTVFSVGEHRGYPYLALEYLDGQSLRGRLRDDPPSERETLRIGLAIAEALVEAHRHEVLHRDLKPENVIIPSDGRLRVVDFGLAKPFARARTAPAVDDDDAADRSAVVAWAPDDDRFTTRRGAIVGTPMYMAPEQWLGQPVTAATDVWALGVILFELLSGRPPFSGASIPELMGAVCGSEPAPAVDVEGVSPGLAGLVAACLAKEPEGRPSTLDVVARLRELLDGGRARPPDAATAPFRGLLPFTERDAALFFGRAAEVATALELLRQEPVLPVVGPSGAGKSSFVQAGLVPALRELNRWLVVSLRPGNSPFATLATRLRRALGREAGSGDLAVRDTTLDSGAAVAASPAASAPPGAEDQGLATALFETPSVLSLSLQRLADESGARVLLFVDQLEELYTLEPDAEVRRRFMEAVCSAADDPQGQVRVVFTLRDDFLGRATETEAARRVLGRIAVLRSPGPEALREILVKPLERAGYRWEAPALVDEMVAAVGGEPACLPVLQFACDQLWEQRDEREKVLTRAAYEAIGGIEGALARHADRVIEELSPEQERLARQVLLRLVTADGTRRVVERAALVDGLGPGAEAVLGRLVAGRMVMSRKGHGSRRAAGEAEVELAHESLVQRWGRLSRWIEESREDVSFLAEVAQAAELWERRGRHPEVLWRGEALADAHRTLRRSTVSVPALVEAFLGAAHARERRRAWLARGLVAAALALLVGVALVLGVLWAEAERQRVEADRQRAEASQERSKAQARQAEATREGARLALANGSVLEARAKLRLALELEGTPSPASRALWWQLARQPLVWRREVGDIINNLAFSPDGDTVALACDDGSVYLVDMTTAQTSVLRGHVVEVFTVAFSPDGATLASGGRDGTAMLWDLRARPRPRARPVRCHDSAVRRVRFSPDGRRLATSSRDRTVKLWDAASLALLHTLSGHGGFIEDIDFSPDSRRIASASADGTARIWDMATGRELKRFTGHSDGVRAVRFIRGGAALATGGLDRTVRFWDVATGAQLREITGHRDGVYSLSVSPDGTRLASAGWDKTVRVWDAATGEPIRSLLHPTPVYTVGFSPDGTRLASANLGRSVFLWDAAMVETDRADEGHELAVTAAAFSPDGTELATSSRDKTLRIWDVATGAQRRVIEGHTDEVWDVHFGRGGDTLFSASWDRTVRVWDAATGAQRRVVEGHTDSVQCLDLDRGEATLVTGGWDNTVRVWDNATVAQRYVLETEFLPRDVVFSPDGSLIAAGCNDGRVWLWDAASGERRGLLTDHGDAVNDVSFSPDGSVLATGSWDKTARLWDVKSLAVKRVVEIPERADAVVFSRDGRRLLVGVADGVARVVDARTGAVLSELRGHLGSINKIALAPGGDSIATASLDGTVRLWDLGAGTPIWRAPLLAPPRAAGAAPLLLSHRGWATVEGPEPGTLRPAAAGSSRWMQAVERTARYADAAGPDGVLCVQTHDGALEVWDTAADRLVGREAIEGLDQVVALPGACAARTRGRGAEGAQARLYDGKAPSRELPVSGPVTALASSGGRLLVAAGAEVLALDLDGTVVDRFPTGEGVTAATIAESGTLVLGFREGNIQLMSPGGVARSRAFEQVSPTAVLRLAAGPTGTVIAGYASGAVGIWDAEDGTLLRRARLHGPVTHLLLQGQTLVAATDLGQYVLWDLGVFFEDRCALMRQVWDAVPVVWRGGRPVAREPPADHACAVRAGRPPAP